MKFIQQFQVIYNYDLDLFTTLLIVTTLENYSKGWNTIMEVDGR